MIDFRVKVDDLLSQYCIDNYIEYTDLHDEAFIVAVNGVWRYVWYDEDISVMCHLDCLKRKLGE